MEFTILANSRVFTLHLVRLVLVTTRRKNRRPGPDAVSQM